MAIPQETIDAIRDALNISDFIGESVELQQRGGNAVGLCPFHSEKTPSFSVNAEKGFYYCFGCGAKGNIFDYVMETRGLTFPEAVRFLAGRAGIIIPEVKRGDSEKQDKDRKKRQLLRDVLVAVQTSYQQSLITAEGKNAKAYLKSRGISEASIEKFALGFVPYSWDFILPATCTALSQQPRSEAITEDACRAALFELGLLKKRDSAEELGEEVKRDYYDLFRNRIICPIQRSDGLPIAFGGRTLSTDKRSPKYLNSPESLFYHKRKTLYGLAQASQNLRKLRQAILVEGYFDVISMHQVGFTHTVATCGTAVTPEHAQLLQRLVDTVFLLFDGDNAGRKAAAQCFEMFLNSGLEVKAVLLPEGEDPDTLARSKTKVEIERLFSKSERPVVDIYLEQLRDEYGTSAAGVGKTAEAFIKVLTRVTNPVEQETLVKRGSEFLGVGIETLSKLLPQANSDRKRVAHREVSEWSVSESFAEPPPIPLEMVYQESPTVTFQENSKRGGKGALEQFCESLLIAVLAEPELAKNVLSVTVSPDTGRVADVLPNNVVTFIREVATGEFQSVNAGSSSKGEKGVDSSLFELLMKHGLPGERLVQQAQEQTRVGGVESRRLIEDTVKLTSRLTIHSEVESLRKQEAGESDTLAKLKLAQDKLLKKRALTKLSRPS